MPRLRGVHRHRQCLRQRLLRGAAGWARGVVHRRQRAGQLLWPLWDVRRQYHVLQRPQQQLWGVLPDGLRRHLRREHVHLHVPDGDVVLRRRRHDLSVMLPDRDVYCLGSEQRRLQLPRAAGLLPQRRFLH